MIENIVKIKWEKNVIIYVNLITTCQKKKKEDKIQFQVTFRKEKTTSEKMQ